MARSFKATSDQQVDVEGAMASQSAYNELSSMSTTQRILDSMGGMYPNSAVSMPELMAEVASTPGMTLADALDQFNATEAAFTIEQQRQIVEAQFEMMGSDWEAKAALWDNLDPAMRQALELDGMSRPSDPSPGGISLPFTSPIKRALNVIPGVNLGPGNAEWAPGFLNNRVGNAANAVINSPDTFLRGGLGSVFSGLDYVSNQLVEQPLRVGQIINEEDGDSLANRAVEGVGMATGGAFGGPLSTSPLSAISNTVTQNALSFARGIFDGRAFEYWAQTEDRNATFRPQVVEETMELLGNDAELHAMAVAMVSSNYNPVDAVAEVTGLEPGMPGYQDVFLEINQRIADDESGAFTEAMERLRVGKIGIGHDAAETMGFEQGTRGHGVVSAMSELAVLSIIDPTLVGGKINRVRKLATYAVNSGQLGMELNRARDLAQLSQDIRRATNAGEALDDVVVAERVIAANQHTVGRLRNSQWQRLLVRDQKQIEYGQRVDNVMARIGDAADPDTAYQWSDLVADVPALRYMRTELVQAAADGKLTAEVVDGIRDTSKIWDFMQTAQGRRGFISGATSRDPRVASLPQLGERQMQWARAKSWFNRTIDLERALPSDMRDDIAQASAQWRSGEITVDEFNRVARKWQDERGALNRFRTNNIFSPQVFLNRLIKHVPRDNYISTEVGNSIEALNKSNRAILDLERFVEIGDLVQMDRATKQAYIEAFTTGTQGERFATVRQFTAEMLIRSGMVDETDELQQLLAKYSFGSDQRFSPSSNPLAIDDIKLGRIEDIGTETALWSTQLAENVAIPDFRNIRAAMVKANTMRAFTGTGYNVIDNAVQKYWKPLVLFSLKFITRASGEEAASTILRLGGTSYARAQFGRRWLYGMTQSPVTGEMVATRELSPFFRRVQWAGAAAQRWSKTSQRQVNQFARQMATDMEQAKVRNLERLMFKPGTDNDKLLAEIGDILRPYQEAYMAERGATSRALHEIGQAAINSAAWASPRMWDMMRKTRIVPSRQQLAEVVLGAKFEGWTASGLPKFAGRSADSLFGAVAAERVHKLTDQVDGIDLVYAEIVARNNPTLARLRAMGLGSAFDTYGEEGVRRMSAEAMMSSEVAWAEKTGRFTGRRRMVPVQRAVNNWTEIDQIQDDARRAIGNAFAYPANDPAIINSGALDVLGTYVGDTVINLLPKRNQGKFISSEKQMQMLTDARAELLDIMSLNDKKSREWVAQFRYAIVNNEPLPLPQYDARSLSQIIGAVNDAGTSQAHRLRGLIYPRQELLEQSLKTDLDETLGEVLQRMSTHMELPSYRAEMEALARMAAKREQAMVRPLPEGMTRLYGVTMMPAATFHLREFAQNPEALANLTEELITSLVQSGISRDEAARVVDTVVRSSGINPNWIDRIDEMAGVGAYDDVVPGINLMFEDPQVAERVAETMDQAMRQMASIVGDNGPVRLGIETKMADIGYVDVDDITLGSGSITRNTDLGIVQFDDVNMAPDVMIFDEFHRIDRGNKVRFVETTDGTWIDEKHRMSMPADQRPDLTGRQQWANGVSEWTLRKDLANERMEAINDLFVTDRGELLTEVIPLLRDGTFDPQFHMMAIPAEDLPSKAYKPEMVDIETLAFHRFVSAGFAEVIQPAIDGIARTPLYMHNFASALGMSADYYHAAVKGQRNDRVLAALADVGFTPERIDGLINEIHMGFGLKTEEGSYMGRLLTALADPNASKEEGTMLLRAVLDDLDAAPLAKREMAEDLIANHVDQFGADDLSPIVEAELDLAALGVGDEYRSVDELDGMIDELEGHRNWLKRTLDDDARSASPSDPARIAEWEDEIARADELIAATKERKAQIATARTTDIRPFNADDPLIELWDDLQGWAKNRYYRHQEAVEQAAVRATDMTVEFIDDHRFRSQFQMTVGNLMPFYFAQEQFIKRQIRMVIDTPESLRRASLLMNAARQSGLIQQDADGNEIFVYPGTKMINEQLLRFAGMVTGIDGLEVRAQPMTANVEYMLPGYSGNAAYMEVGTGPFVGFVTSSLSMAFPELTPIDDALNVEIGEGRKPWDHFVPPSLQRFMAASGLEYFDNGRFMNAQLRAIQISAANGTAPAETASPSEKQEWLDRIRMHARVINLMDAVMYVGAPLPSGATVNFGDAELSDDFRQIVFDSGLPYQEGLALYFEQHPDATPFTVFGTESTTGAPIGSTDEVYQWLVDNESLLKDYPLAAAFLAPPNQIDDDEEWSRRASAEIYRQELRSRRSPEEYLEQLYVSDASTDFYEMTDAYDRAIYFAEKQGDQATVAQLEEDKAFRIEEFERMHPVFASDRRSGEGFARREMAKAQRDALLSMPRDQLPQGEHVDTMLTMMARHQQFNAAMDSLKGQRDTASAEAREMLRTEFLLWAAQYSQLHPNTQPYFSANIRWDSHIQDGGSSWMIELETALGREL